MLTFAQFKEKVLAESSLNEGLSKEQLLAIKKHYSNHDNIMADIGDYEYYKKHNDNKSAESIAKKLKSIAIDDKVILDEAHKIGNKVTIHKGTGAGITGHIGEISRKFKGDTDPTYTIFHGDNEAITASKKQIKAVKEDLDEKFAHPNHKKLDANGNGELDAEDFKLLRAKKKTAASKLTKEENEVLESLLAKLDEKCAMKPVKEDDAEDDTEEDDDEECDETCDSKAKK